MGLDSSFVWYFLGQNLSFLFQNKLLGESNEVSKFIWNPLVPRKVNVCLWRMYLDHLPSRENLTKRGVILNSLSCLFCSSDMENLEHCLFNCPKIKPIWLKCWSWWHVCPSPLLCVHDITEGKWAPHGSNHMNKIFQGVCYVLFWSLWKWRNKILHAPSQEIEKATNDDIFPSVQNLSFLWVSNRCKHFNYSWSSWVSNPLGDVPT